jgi:hypothetical protein
MGNNFDYNFKRKDQKSSISENKYPSIEDHETYCKKHDSFSKGITCKLCNVNKNSIDKAFDDLEDLLYFMGIMKKPSQSTIKAIKQTEKFNDKKTRNTNPKNRSKNSGHKGQGLRPSK